MRQNRPKARATGYLERAELAGLAHVRQLQKGADGDRPYAERTVRDELGLVVLKTAAARQRADIAAEQPRQVVTVTEHPVLHDPEFWRRAVAVPELRRLMLDALQAAPALEAVDGES